MPSTAAICVRPATRADLDALVALEVAAFAGDRISRAQWRRHVASGTASVLVADRQGQVEAAAVVFYRRGARRARLYSLAVAEAARGRGRATAMLAAIEADARARGCETLGLEVRCDNPAAIALYERRGYQRVGRLAGYYDDGTDGWRYAASLTPVTS